MEALKRKQAAGHKQYQSNDKTPGGSGQGFNDEDGELAPTRASEHDAILGTPVDAGYAADSFEEHNQNQTALGKQGGLEKNGKQTSPANSKDLFQDPKVDTHDPVDLNRDRNMAGDGSNSKYDKMGVDEHVDPRMQSSKLAAANMKMNQSIKDRSRKQVKSAMNIKDNVPSMGEDAPGAVSDNQMQKGFAAPVSRVNQAGEDLKWDQDRDGVQGSGAGNEGLYDNNADEGVDQHMPEPKKRFSGIKGARAKLDGFLNRRKA